MACTDRLWRRASGVRVRIVSWTLAGPGTAPIIGDALRSGAPIANRFLVIWTGHEGRAPVDHEAFMVAGAYDGQTWLTLKEWPWCDDFSAARNAALSFAAETGADWSMMIDTDERVICPDPDAFRVWLAALPDTVCVALAHAADGSHTRERFFRLPSKYQFIGRTHEMFPAPMHEQAIIPRELITWSELLKTPEQLRAKFTRDVEMLRADIADNPANGSAQYYLGASLQSLGQYEEAIVAFRAHHALDGWEGGAWSCFKAAECYLMLNQPNRALDCIAAGLVRDAGIGELYWIAGLASLQEGRHEQARCWAEAAKLHGMGSASEKRRRGFRDVRGLTTGPDDVILAAESMRKNIEDVPITIGFTEPKPIKLISRSIRPEVEFTDE